MEQYINDDFLLQNETAKGLFHSHAKNLPIIDYHCHLSPKDIAENRQFNNISEAWLEGDHYKWRAMRANGVSEKNCSGDAPAKEKFISWAETVPYSLGNPLYHWSHLELKRYFNIDKLINPGNAEYIWEAANEQIVKAEFNVQGLLKKMNIELICTTDDPIDSLEYHKTIKESELEINILPTFRPDKALAISDIHTFGNYLSSLSEASGSRTDNYDHFLVALARRIDYFSSNNCKISDHAFTYMPLQEYSLSEVRSIFSKARSGKQISEEESDKFRLATMKELAALYAMKGWTMQLHFGALRDNNSRILKKHGTDGGADSIGNEFKIKNLSFFLDSLDKENKLPPSILYNLNPSDNEALASMAANFQSCMPGKMQYGAAWWFLDNKNGIESQLQTVANHGLLGRFVGMLTDSRSFLSYPRHEYFRRILCNMIGEKKESGEFPDDTDLLSKMIEDICYYNAKNYFNF